MGLSRLRKSPQRRVRSGGGGTGPAHPELPLGDLLVGPLKDVAPVCPAIAHSQQRIVDGTGIVAVQVGEVRGHHEFAISHRRSQLSVQVQLARLPENGTVVRNRVAAEALVLETGSTQEVLLLAGNAAGARLHARHAVAAAHVREFRAERLVGRPPGLEAQHPARAVAVGGRTGPAQRFHTAEGAQVEVVEGRLPVGKSGGNAVHQHRDPAHAELGAGAEAADGNTLAHRGVVAVLHLDAGKTLERFLDGEPGLAPRERRLAEHRHGEGNLAQQDRRAQHRDLDLVERNHRGRVGFLGREWGGDAGQGERQGETRERELTGRDPSDRRAGRAPGPGPHGGAMQRRGHRRAVGWGEPRCARSCRQCATGRSPVNDTTLASNAPYPARRFTRLGTCADSSRTTGS